MIRNLLGDQQEVIVEVGNRPVMVRIIHPEPYDLDRELEDPRVAEAVEKGYADAAAGRLIDHGEVVRRVTLPFSKLESTITTAFSSM